MISVRKVGKTMEEQVGLMANTMVESLAGASSESVILADYPALETLARNAVAQEDDLISVNIQRADGTVVASARSPHANEAENLRHFTAPILVRLQDGQADQVGTVDLGWSNDRSVRYRGLHRVSTLRSHHGCGPP